MAFTLSSVSKFCLRLTNWSFRFHCLLARGQISPGLWITLGWERCVKSRWLRCVCAPLLLTSTLHSLLAFIHYLCRSWYYCSSWLSRLVFIFFLARFPFIFCSLSAPRRAKAGRIANSPFPRLAPVCRRGGRGSPESLTLSSVSFIDQAVDKTEVAKTPRHPSFQLCSSVPFN